MPSIVWRHGCRHPMRHSGRARAVLQVRRRVSPGASIRSGRMTVCWEGCAGGPGVRVHRIGEISMLPLPQRCPAGQKSRLAMKSA